MRSICCSQFPLRVPHESNRKRVFSPRRVIVAADSVHFTDADGIGLCRLWLDPQVAPVAPRPFRPFQGWRYLKPDDAPPDLGGSTGVARMPEALRRELSALGLL